MINRNCSLAIKKKTLLCDWVNEIDYNMVICKCLTYTCQFLCACGRGIFLSILQYSSPCISRSLDTVLSNAKISSSPVNMLAS